MDGFVDLNDFGKTLSKSPKKMLLFFLMGERAK
jgi:hypothetical protein